MKVLEIILPVLVMILLGMACKRLKLLDQNGINNMKLLVTQIMLPVAIFHALATADYNKETGLEWIKRIKSRYPHMVWLNPIAERRWAHTYGNSTIGLIRNEVPMFELSLSGLDAAIKKLLVNR